MDVTFYDVKSRTKVAVSPSEVKKVTYERQTSKGTQIRYALKAVHNGTSLTKFVSKEDWEALG